jgi:hypothetical protein
MIYSKDTYYVVRTKNAGAYVGYIDEINEETGRCVLKNSRMLWYWEGAASLSELANAGVSKPEKCKFPCPVEQRTLFGIIEIIPMTQKAKESVMNVPVWSAHYE